ncbi:astacin metalloprotease toxin 3, partial [Biomphalaria glabrata]
PETPAPPNVEESVTKEEVESNEEYEDAGGEQSQVVERELSRPGSVYRITLVEKGTTRGRRAVSNTNKIWPKKIPYIIETSYRNKGIYYTIVLKRAMQYLMDRVCITLVDVTGQIIDTAWLTNNGFETQSYIRITDNGNCVGEIGPSNYGGRLVSPCSDFWINLHEMGHALGSMHVQESSYRDNYMTLYPDNIQPSSVAVRGYSVLKQPLPCDVREQPQPCDVREQPLPCDVREQPLPCDVREQPLPCDVREQLLPCDVREQPLPCDVREQPLPFNVREHPLPCDVREQPLPCDVREQLLPCDVREQPLPCDVREQLLPCDVREQLLPCDVREQLLPCDVREQPLPCDVREQLLPCDVREQLLPCDVREHTLPCEIRASEVNPKDPLGSLSIATSSKVMVRKYANASALISSYFDPKSVLMYSPGTWSRNGLDTYSTIRDDFFNTASDTSTDDVMFYDLSQLYKCRETFCSETDVDCSPGYYTLIKGECRCVCPSEREESTNCKTLRNGPSTTAKWPLTPFVLFAGGPQHTCPVGFTPGWYSFTGTSPITQAVTKPPVLFPVSGKTNDIPLCTKDAPSDTPIDWESWPPGGQYCMVKPASESCGGGFVESRLEVQSLAAVRYNGSIGDTVVNGNNITQKYCCRYQESTTFPIDLPNRDPFRLMVRSTCPKIRGLKSVLTRNNLWSSIYTLTNASTSPYWPFSTCLTTFSCYYLPPVYGCNQDITLDATTRTATVTTPGFPTAREPNRRCFYNFNVPPGSQIKLTFNTFDLSVASDDNFLIKRYHKWQDPYRIDETNFPKDTISEGDYLSVEYWSGFDVTTKKGVSFTASVILPEELCYDSAQKGADYSGNTYITETYEECLPWSQTVDCDNFPDTDALWLLRSENSCRNPEGSMLQPWCYISRNGTCCQKRYCDVCQLQTIVDVIKNCAALMAADPDFCSTSLSKNGCAKSCGYTPLPLTRGTCEPPTVPSDGTQSSDAKSTYNEGDIVQVKCTDSPADPVSEMKCTSSGWTALSSACRGGCDDKVSFCQDILRSFPRFCSHTKTRATATQYCAKSCSICSASSTCSSPSVSTFTRTSSAESVSGGVFMSFTCSPGLYYWSGDRERACGLNGDLLGNNLDCQVQPPITDVNLNLVRKRLDLLKTGTAYLMDFDTYRVPFKGVITRWYYFCKTPGVMTFAVYRKVNNVFTYVGANNVTCQPDYLMTYYVPLQDQISVQEKDVFAVFSAVANTLYVSDCNSNDKVLVNQVIAANNFNELATKPVSGTYCLVPSYAARVQPA